ncbi:hypothetical protein AGMMS50276_01310 [Synergistales bacterium]|nr:hypothetical protein AGMMS50276_01310 [Synergistales bacterium]
MSVAAEDRAKTSELTFAPDRAVKEAVFLSEVKRLESGVSETRTLQDKIESKTEKAINDLRAEMKKGFEQVDKRFEQMSADMNRRFEQVDKRFEQVDKRFEQVDKRFEQMSSDMNKRLEKIDAQFEQARRENVSRFDIIIQDNANRSDTATSEMRGFYRHTTTLFLTALGVVLAAFYSFLTFIR